MPIEILPFTPRDIADALELWDQSEGVGLFGDTPQLLEGCLTRNPGMSFVARDGTELVGAVLCTTDGRRGYLHHLAVARTHRRRGIGTRLATACLTELERIGVPRCHLFVHRGNDTALGFWARYGWAERPEIIMMSRDVRVDR